MFQPIFFVCLFSFLLKLIASSIRLQLPFLCKDWLHLSLGHHSFFTWHCTYLYLLCLPLILMAFMKTALLPFMPLVVVIYLCLSLSDINLPHLYYCFVLILVVSKSWHPGYWRVLAEFIILSYVIRFPLCRDNLLLSSV